MGSHIVLGEEIWRFARTASNHLVDDSVEVVVVVDGRTWDG